MSSPVTVYVDEAKPGQTVITNISVFEMSFADAAKNISMLPITRLVETASPDLDWNVGAFGLTVHTADGYLMHFVSNDSYLS